MSQCEDLPNGNIRVTIPMSFRYIRQQKIINIPETEENIVNNTPLLLNIARGLVWQKMLDERRVASVDDLAKAVGRERAVVSHALQLTLLSPEIIHLALIGALPKNITLKTFPSGIPADWQKQKEFLGIT